MYFIFKVTEITHGPNLYGHIKCFLCYVRWSAKQSMEECKAFAVVFNTEVWTQAEALKL